MRSPKSRILWWVLLSQMLCSNFIAVSLDVAIVSMVDYSYPTSDSSTSSNATICSNTTSFSQIYDNSIVQRISIFQGENVLHSHSHSQYSKKEEAYNWSTYDVNVVLAGYSWLNSLAIIVGGFLSHKHGGKCVAGYCQLIASCISFFIPFSANCGPIVLACVRAIQGFFASFYLPSAFSTIVGDWCPPQSRGRFYLIISLGMTLGTGLGNFLFGLIAQFTNWRYVFYACGCYGVCCSIVWFQLVHNTPTEHPTISKNEREFILKKIGISSSQIRVPIPWRHLLTDFSIFVCALGIVFSTWPNAMFTTYLPTYLKSIYQLETNEIGVIASIPQLLAAVTAIFAAHLSDKLVKAKSLPLTRIRKLFIVIGFFGGALPLIVQTAVGCNLNAVVICILLSATLRNFCTFGPPLMLIDSNPKFSGTLLSFAALLSSASTTLFTSIVSLISAKQSTDELWNTVFFYTAMMQIFAGVLCLLFATSELRPWNRFDYEHIIGNTRS